jgi:hypothetical protein
VQPTRATFDAFVPEVVRRGRPVRGDRPDVFIICATTDTRTSKRAIELQRPGRRSAWPASPIGQLADIFVAAEEYRGKCSFIEADR